MLEILITQNESKTLEFKENTKNLTGIIKSIIAFANTAGGIIAIGIRDGSKDILGLENILAEEERLASAIADNIRPLLVPDIEIHSFRQKEIIILRVPHAIGPYYLKSAGFEHGTYIRLGSTNRVADKETLDSLKLYAKNVSFDEMPCLGSNLEDIDWQLVDLEFEKVGKKVNTHTYERLGLLSNRQGKKMLTHGSILVFSGDRFKIFPDSQIRCARFLSTTKENILDQQDIKSPLLQAIDAVLTFIEQHTHQRAEIGRIRRQDISQYPPLALREGLINAIVHCDYAMQGVNIQVALFEDRIEITNPGGLLFGMTLEHALSGASRLRNRAIGRIFRELKIIEQWGSGLRRIIHACKQHGLQPPLFEELGNQFRLTLYNVPLSEPILSDWQVQLIEYFRTTTRISPSQAAKLWGVSTRTARTRLKDMSESGVISRIGTSKKDPGAVYVSETKLGVFD